VWCIDKVESRHLIAPDKKERNKERNKKKKKKTKTTTSPELQAAIPSAGEATKQEAGHERLNVCQRWQGKIEIIEIKKKKKKTTRT
jgi:hypothetical protein